MPRSNGVAGIVDAVALGQAMLEEEAQQRVVRLVRPSCAAALLPEGGCLTHLTQCHGAKKSERLRDDPRRRERRDKAPLPLGRYRVGARVRVDMGREREQRIVRVELGAGVGYGGGGLPTRPPVADRLPRSGACIAWSRGGRFRATVLGGPIERLIGGHSRR